MYRIEFRATAEASFVWVGRIASEYWAAYADQRAVIDMANREAGYVQYRMVEGETGEVLYPAPATLEDAIASDWQGLLDDAPEETAPYAPVPAVRPEDRRNVNEWAAIARTVASALTPRGTDSQYYRPAGRDSTYREGYARTNRAAAPFEVARAPHTVYARTMEHAAVRVARD